MLWAKRNLPDSTFRCGHQGYKRPTEHVATYEASMMPVAKCVSFKKDPRYAR